VRRVEGKVAFITGAARGQGRSHAVRLANEGADIIAMDRLANVDSVAYSMATMEDMEETVALVRKAGRRVVARTGDVRRQEDLDEAVREGLGEFGHIDVVCANAGISSFGAVYELSEDQWIDVIDTNLNGVWRTIKAVAPSMIGYGKGGSIIITSSIAAFKGSPNSSHYAASKAGLIGLMHSAANGLAPHNIRVNTLHPTGVATEMIQSPASLKRFCPNVESPSLTDLRGAFSNANSLDIPWLEPEDVSDAVLWLASDEAKYVTGIALPIDAGALNKG
jgi:(+)-trans-carveol dehydrogenase